MKRLSAIALGALLCLAQADAQTSPGLIQGQVPTPAQWNSYFANKQDYIPFGLGVSTALQQPANGTGGPELVGSGTSAHAQFVSIGAPPVASGSCAISTQLGGQSAGRFVATGSCSAQTIILTFTTPAPTGWACDAHDLTTPADTVKETAYTASTVTFTATMAASDLAVFACTGF